MQSDIIGWIRFGVEILLLAISLVMTVRHFERRIDLIAATLYGAQGTNGLKKAVDDLEAWRDNQRVDLPDKLRLVKHDAVAVFTPVTLKLGQDLGEIDDRVRAVELHCARLGGAEEMAEALAKRLEVRPR